MADAGYMICTTPRSGSTLLCTLLRATGAAGWPESHFHGPSLATWAKRFDLAPDAGLEPIIAAALKKGRNGGPIFAARQQWPSFPLLLTELAKQRTEETDRARLEAALGPLTYIHLSRGDKLAQAISYIRAEQTGLWHRNADGSIYEALPPRSQDGYDRDAITRQIADLEQADENWRQWFAAAGIAPLTLNYAELADTPQKALIRVLDWIGLDPVLATGVTPPTQKLADDVNAEWTARYIAETGYG